MARPTREEQERKRIEALRAEGKTPDGDPIEDAQIVSETKTPPKPKQQSVQADFTIEELDEELNNATMGTSGDKPVEPKTGMNIGQDDFTKGDRNDPNHISQENYNPFAEPLIQNESDANKASMGSQQRTTGGSRSQPPPPVEKTFEEPIINGGAPTEEPKKEEPKPINPSLDQLTPTQRAEQVEMFADAILTHYQQLLPAIPKMICKYNMGKMQLMDKEGIIRLSMTINRSEDGKEIKLVEHMTNFNEEVDRVFVVTDEMKQQLKPSLVAVLTDKGIAPTPMMTLLTVSASHMIMFIMASIEMNSKRNMHIEEFKEFRKDEIILEREKHKAQQYNPNAQQQKQPDPVKQPEPSKVSMDDVISGTPTIVSNSVAEVKENSQPVQNGITIEEILD